MVHIRDLLSYVAKQARNKRRGPTKPAAVVPAIEVAPENIQKTTRSAKQNFDLARVDLQKTLAEAGIIRKILFVPPSMLASDLLRRMQVNRTQMALVIDEYGGTDGLASHEAFEPVLMILPENIVKLTPVAKGNLQMSAANRRSGQINPRR